MPKIKLSWLALGLCLLFTVFSLGFYLGGRPKSGVYAIVTEQRPGDAPDATADSEGTPDHATISAAPSTSAPASASPPTAAAPEKDARININTATAEELTDLPGIGPVLAGRIVAYRDAHGPFAAPEDIINVSGVGEKILADILPYITV